MRNIASLLTLVMLFLTLGVGSAQEEEVGYEILQIVSPNEIITWLNVDGMTQAEFDALELPPGWIKNQPREVIPSGGAFAQSPGAEVAGEFVDETHFGHQWRHVATIVEADAPLDDEGLLAANTINKFHQVVFSAGTTLPVLVSPEGDIYPMITRDTGRTSETFALPDGWQLTEITLTEDPVVQLPNPTINIRTENEDSFQGPVGELAGLIGAVEQGDSDDLGLRDNEQACSDLIESNDKAGRWICSAIDNINTDPMLGDEALTQVTAGLFAFAAEPATRCDGSMDELLTTMRDNFPTFTDHATLEVERLIARVCSPLTYHEGYWGTEIQGMRGAINLSDVHVDAATKSVRVYAQVQVMGQIAVPVQAGPGECAEMLDGETVCYHPNAVYLNGSGQELLASDGTGSWWVKHAWILDGEGYGNCELGDRVYDNCPWIEGELLEDGLTMRMAGTSEMASNFFNLRTPLLDEDPITYRVTRIQPTNIDPEAGEIDMTPVVGFELVYECQEEPSPFDGLVRSCPTVSNP